MLLQDRHFKLCDFGSAAYVKTTPVSEADYEEFERYTTLMYRPPEMIDKYLGWPVTTKVDVWVSAAADYNLSLDARVCSLLIVFCAAPFPRQESTCYSER